MSLPTGSTEFLYVAMTGPEADELSEHVAELAIVLRGIEVVEADWTEAEWADDQVGSVRLLLGPASSFGALDAGNYNIWTRITSAPEIPVRKAGGLRVVDMV